MRFLLRTSGLAALVFPFLTVFVSASSLNREGWFSLEKDEWNAFTAAVFLFFLSTATTGIFEQPWPVFLVCLPWLSQLASLPCFPLLALMSWASFTAKNRINYLAFSLNFYEELAEDDSKKIQKIRERLSFLYTYRLAIILPSAWFRTKKRGLRRGPAWYHVLQAAEVKCHYYQWLLSGSPVPIFQRRKNVTPAISRTWKIDAI